MCMWSGVQSVRSRTGINDTHSGLEQRGSFGLRPDVAHAFQKSFSVAGVVGSAGTQALPRSVRSVVLATSAGSGLPPGVPVPPTGSNQLVTVLVPRASSTSGVLRGWRRESGGQWASVFGPVTVRVGTQGVGTAHEGINRTPRGTFDVPSAFGRQPNPGTRMPYRQVGTSDWWVSNQHSPSYNT